MRIWVKFDDGTDATFDVEVVEVPPSVNIDVSTGAIRITEPEEES